MIRILYLISMYTGVRAAYNKFYSFFLPHLRTTVLDSTTLQIDGDNLAKIRVNARRPPKALTSRHNAGMISVYLVSPGICRLTYSLLRLSSHFAIGHVEIAFYETDKYVSCFAVRNILRSNIRRLRLENLFRNLKLSKDKDEIAILERILEELNARGINACLSSPEECVSFAVNQSLLNPQTSDLANDALKRKYERISRRIARNNKVIHAKPDLC